MRDWRMSVAFVGTIIELNVIDITPSLFVLYNRTL